MFEDSVLEGPVDPAGEETSRVAQGLSHVRRDHSLYEVILHGLHLLEGDLWDVVHLAKGREARLEVVGQHVGGADCDIVIG